MSKAQQPIDKLFARKLDELEGTPSPQAWNRLESRLGQKKTRKGGMIWLSYAAAAAVVLLLGALWVIFSSETPSSQPGIAARETTKGTTAHPKANPPKAETPRPSATQPAAENLAQAPAPQPEEAPAAPATAMPPAAEKTETKTERLAHAGSPRGRQPVVTTPDEQPVRRPEAPAPLPAPEEQMARNPVRTAEPARELPTPEEQTLVVVVQLPADTGAPKTAFAGEAVAEEEELAEAEATPRTRTGRLLQGLKKAKRGEFRELGLTPDHLLARFRDKADKAAED
ncbi:MAG: hypothetical protein AVDCRST_MAG56-7789 [uncultured Cytophagales bacterium]|uniref:Uncharacterized protein n=1 Tax=uncultured Cytophagales bacterium TaxID=158755 RepID=A0A6J4LFN4_9SPHI|nr:MAG: hypothetical protein AVDCRST_MAG56-7789 [uncultured Cytophagales bacterium]